MSGARLPINHERTSPNSDVKVDIRYENFGDALLASDCEHKWTGYYSHFICIRSEIWEFLEIVIYSRRGDFLVSDV